MVRRQGADILTSSASPPIAAKRPTFTVHHGERLEDDYAWLRDKANPAVAAYLEAENAYTDAVMAPTVPLQEQLYQEMVSHIQQTDEDVPSRLGDYLYYTRTEEGKQYPFYCRRRAEGDPTEELLLDLNALAEGHPFLGLGAYAVSDDASLLAYSLDFTGFRQYTLFVKDLRAGTVLPDRAENVGSVSWAADNRTLFYTVEDAAKRQYRLYRHRLGAEPDALVFEETDERFSVHVSRTLSRAFLLMETASLTSGEVWYLDGSRPECEWKLITPREPEHEYDVDHGGDLFYIRTNSGGVNFRLAVAPVSNPGRDHWQEVTPHRPDVMLERITVFENHYVRWEREAGLQRIVARCLATGQERAAAYPDPAYSVFPAGNLEFHTSKVRFRYESLVTPSSVFDFDLGSGEQSLLKETLVPGYDKSLYTSERLFAEAPDGARVPISLVYKRGVKIDGTAPLHLSAYGSYGLPRAVNFHSNRLCLLDRGVVWAMAHIRGGGDLGKQWHIDGRMLKKRNTFTDFSAAAEHLVRSGYAAPDRVAIEGGSAGGLLMGAVANMRPDLFRAVVSHVPFVDVINTMSDTTLPLTVGEFEEWGNPENPEEYAYMRSYCPYTNLERKDYPAMLVKTAFNDSQVMYWEPAKYVAKLRTLKTDDNPLMLKTNMAAGHGGASGRYNHMREIALDFAFILWQLGVAHV